MEQLPTDLSERAFTNLLRHLEWEGDRFSISFIFADVGPAKALADWLDERLSLVERPLNRVVGSDTLLPNGEAAVAHMVSRLSELSVSGGAVWYEAHLQPIDPAWDRGRISFLARLNERRFLLERGLSVPLVVVLPAEFRSEVSRTAPDIWHVRALSEQLPSSASPASNWVRRSFEPVVLAPADRPTPAYAAWDESLSAHGHDAELHKGRAAVAELLDRGRLANARQLGDAVLDIARARCAVDASLINKRELALCIDAAADVAKAGGDADAAHGFYAESLAVTRQVAAAQSDPEVDHDLAVSLDNLASVSKELGNPGEAEALLLEGLSIRRRLVAHGGSSSSALEGVSTSLGRIGQLRSERGDQVGAEAAFAEAIEAARRLVTAEARSGSSLRRLSLALDRAGIAATDRGDFDNAAALLNESLQIGRELTARPDHTNDDTRDVLIGLSQLAYNSLVQGKLDRAERLWLEGLSIARHLIQATGGSYGALRDLTVELNNLGDLAVARGDTTRAKAWYGESLSIRRQLADRTDAPLGAQRDLAFSLKKVGEAAQNEGDWRSAAAMFEEALELHRKLVQRVGRTPEALRYLSIALDDVALLAREENDWTSAQRVHQESLDVLREIATLTGYGPQTQIDLAISLKNAADAEHALGLAGSAETKYRESLGLVRSALGSVATPHTLRALTNVLFGLATVLEMRGARDEAILLLRESAEIGRNLIAKSETPFHLDDWVIVVDKLATMLEVEGQATEGRDVVLNATDVIREQVTRFGRTEYVLNHLAAMLERLAWHSINADESGRGAAALREAVAIRREVLTHFGVTARAGEAIARTLLQLYILTGDVEAQDEARAVLESLPNSQELIALHAAHLERPTAGQG